MAMTNSRKRKGYTLLEVVVAAAIMMILSAAVLLGTTNVLRVSEYEDHVLTLDKQGYRLMQELSDQLRSAILPFPTNKLNPSNSIASGQSAGADDDDIFKLLDDTIHGLAGNDNDWLAKLKEGVDSLAFVVPVDAQDDRDSLDDNNRLEVGQIRPDGVHSLDTQFTVSGDSFALRTDVPASSLVDVDLEALNNDNRGGLYEVDFLGPTGIMRSSRTTEHSSFNVIRYIPKRGSGGLVELRESELGADLDEDGAFDSVFNIGRIQLVYIGGMQYVQPRRAEGDIDSVNPPNALAPVDTIMIDLSGDVVLRNIDGESPIFKLKFIDPASLNEDDDDGNTANMALHIRALLFNPSSFESMRPRFGAHKGSGASDVRLDTEIGFARMFDSVVTLRNMSR